LDFIHCPVSQEQTKVQKHNSFKECSCVPDQATTGRNRLGKEFGPHW